jgi:lysozyme family protein
MSENFDYAIPFILQHEGGYVDDLADRGGRTNFGISQRSYPSVDIANLTRDGAITIYQRDFWQAAWDDLDKRVAAKVMDISVNCGMSWGPKILQRVLGVVDDGVIGPATLAAANAMDADTLLQGMADKMIEHYQAIVAAHPIDQKFMANWSHRAQWIPTT